MYSTIIYILLQASQALVDFRNCRSVIDEILKLEPDVVGFTQYYTSEQPTNYMASELKRRAPNIITAVGGSNVQKDWFKAEPFYDYVVNGEGEQAA